MDVYNDKFETNKMKKIMWDEDNKKYCKYLKGKKEEKSNFFVMKMMIMIIKIEGEKWRKNQNFLVMKIIQIMESRKMMILHIELI